MSEPDYLTTTQAAKIAGCYIGTIALWCKQGSLPHIRPGVDFLVKRADLVTFLKKPRNRPGQYDRSTIKKRKEL
jgi:excisionase family DNA binding protein